MRWVQLCGSPITSRQIDGEKVATVTSSTFLGSKITVDSDCSHEIKKMLDPWKKNYDKPRQHIKKQRHHFAVKGTQSQSYGFSSIHRGCESWTIKKTESWRIDGFKLWYWGRLLSPVDCQETKLVNTKRNQPWIFTGRTDAEAEALILWLPDVKSWLIGKGPNARKDWGQKKVVTENKMVGWHHWLNGHESEQILGDS